MKKKIIFMLLFLIIIIFISTNSIEIIQYHLLNEQGKELYDLIEDQKRISENYVEEINEDIVKIPLVDLSNPILPNGEMLEISVIGNLGIDEKVTIKMKFDISRFEKTVDNCDDFKIYAVSEYDEFLYLIVSSRQRGSNKYNATLCGYDVNKAEVFGNFNHVGTTLYYDNKDNIIFSSNGLKFDESKNGTSVELKYHYNISKMLNREIKDEQILKKLRSIKN